MMFSGLYILLGAVVVIGLLALWTRHNRPVLAFNAPPPPATACRAEALILGVIAAVILIIGSTDYRNNGMMSRLADLPFELACFHVGLLLAAILFSAAAVKLASLGFTRGAIIVLACTLLVYGLFINGPGRPINAIPAETNSEPDAHLTIDVSGINIAEGVDLWVNGAYLGKTPVQTTLNAFLEKVPDVPEMVNRDSYLYVYANREPLSSSKTGYLTNARLFESLNGGDRPELARLAKPLYATVEYAGERGLTTGSAGWGRTGSGSAMAQVSTYFEVIFPARRHRLEELLNLARLNDFTVDVEWLEVLDGFGMDGCLMLRHLGETSDVLDFDGDVQGNAERPPEPGFLDILRQWAAWKYDLDTVRDSTSAWSAFTCVMNAADDSGIYLSEGVEGVAVETLAPQLDPEAVIDRAVEMLDAYGTYNLLHWRANGQPAFGIVTRPGTVTLQLGSQGGATNSSAGSARNPARFPPSAAAVAHALWLMDQRMDTEGPEPNPVESTIATKLLQCAYGRSGSHFALPLATEIGGPVVADYVLRHDWQASVEQNRQQNYGDDGMSLMFGATVNKWCYSLAQLNEPNASKARVGSKDVFLDLAQYLVKNSHGSDPETMLDRLGYLFDDLEAGEESLAMLFWPVLVDSMETGGPWATGMLFPYLLRMEPMSTSEMYVDAWSLVAEDGDAVEFAVIYLRELQQLPEEKRMQILNAIGGPESAPFDKDEYVRMKHELFPDALWTKSVVDSLHNPEGRDVSPSMARWLESTAPTHALVGILAEDPDPEIRTLVLGALRACPTPANRTVLAMLLNDPDPKVRAAAQKVQRELQELAATPPSTFASNATTFSATEAGRYLTTKQGERQE